MMPQPLPRASVGEALNQGVAHLQAQRSPLEYPGGILNELPEVDSQWDVESAVPHTHPVETPNKY